MSKKKGFVQISAKGWLERFEIAWKVIIYGNIQFDFELLEDLAKSYIEAERNKQNEN